MPFSKLGLKNQIVENLSALEYVSPTPIQEQAIPHIIAGHDLIGCAQTGTGKTAAFMLPLVQKILEAGAAKSPSPLGLVITPTRELAQQIYDCTQDFSRHTPLRSIALYGGVNVQSHIKRLKKGTDLVIATPGRLLDMMQQRAVDLSNVTTVVIDEADRMFDMGFIRDVRSILHAVPKKRQTLLFSATMSADVQKLVASIQNNPVFIDLGQRREPAATVEQEFFGVGQEAKVDFLLQLLYARKPVSTLIFTRTKHGADRVAKRLDHAGFSAVAIHSNRTQSQRQRALADFKQGNIAVLVATDIASRGIDVDGISYVINYDIPSYSEDYIHRIGRTGRAEATGNAVTFVAPGDRNDFKKLLHFTGQTFKLLSAAESGFPPLAHAPEAAPKRRKATSSKPAPARAHRTHTTDHAEEAATPSVEEFHEKPHTEQHLPETATTAPIENGAPETAPETSETTERQPQRSDVPSHPYKKRFGDSDRNNRGRQQNGRSSERRPNDRDHRNGSFDRNSRRPDADNRNKTFAPKRRDDTPHRPGQGQDRYKGNNPKPYGARDNAKRPYFDRDNRPKASSDQDGSTSNNNSAPRPYPKKEYRPNQSKDQGRYGKPQGSGSSFNPSNRFRSSDPNKKFAGKKRGFTPGAQRDTIQFAKKHVRANPGTPGAEQDWKPLLEHEGEDKGTWSNKIRKIFLKRSR